MENRLANSITKSLLKTSFIFPAIILLVGLAGCKTNSMVKCPDLISARSSKPHEKSLAHNYHRPDHAKSLNTQAQNIVPVTPDAGVAAKLTASADKDVPLQIKLPPLVARKMGDDEQLSKMNTVLNDFSADKVSLVRKDNGKIYLTAGSAKDLVVLTKNVAKVMAPRGYYEKRYGSDGGGGDREGAAIASGVLGTVGFVFSFFPFLDLAAIPICLAAIVTGAIGIGSHRRGLAVTGLALGVLGLIIAIISALIYFTWFLLFAL